MGIQVGVDVGGTFTDAAVAAEGEVVRAKATSTRDVTSGILDALSRVRQQLELGEDEFFASIDKFVLGNTIVTNVIDELRFPQVGLLTTAGFKDTLRIARSARGPSRDAHSHTAPPELVRRDRIVEVAERVDVDGDVLRAGRSGRAARRRPAAARPRASRRSPSASCGRSRTRSTSRRRRTIVARARARAAADAVLRARPGLSRVRADGDHRPGRRVQAGRRHALRRARRRRWSSAACGSG